MPRFVSLTLDEFTDLLQRFDFTRRIDGVHMHHTWRPNHSQYRGEATIEGMWRFHTQTNGWRDIAQHASIGPDGSIWTGRDWNLPPASATGFNGNSMAGPFMFETIGDFDRGQDRLEGAQLAAVVGVIARVQERFGLGPDSLRFHRSMTNLKSCPGTGVDLDEIRAAVGNARAQLGGGARAARAIDAWAGPESLRGRERTDEALRIWRHAGATAGAARAMDPGDAEPAESEMSDEHALMAGATGTTRAAPGGQRGARDVDLTPEILAALRPHVVNLNQGQLSEGGLFSTSRADVDAMFDDHLPRAAAEAAAGGQPLRILFWAHGGLIDEANGLRIAHLQVSWWKRNGVYPIHFVWETGFVDALKQILSGARRPGPRGVARDIWDHTTDLAVEAVARTLGGAKIWSAMKRSAELAAADDGGATYVAERVRTFCQAPPCPVELHAVGHSAGSIFHAHFLPAALGRGAPAFKTLQLLAPAIRVDAFKQHLLGHVGPAIQALTMFTMKRDWEEGDHVAQVYRKSLLYLVHHALERDRKTPILGLETSLRDDRQLVALFGLGGPRSLHEVVWSVSEATTGPSASTSRSHGGFDNDRATMDAVASRILGAPPAVTFPDEAMGRGLDLWSEPPALPQALAPFFTWPGAGDAPAAGTSPSAVPPGGWGSAAGAPPAGASPAAGAQVAPGPAAPGGRRRALCVGIDRYPTMPLAGCVADARDWAQSFDALGFDTALLLDEAATRTRILDDLRALLAGSRPGDVLAFQFAGHGTELPDLDGDEVDGANGPKDEALCPYDITQGAFVIDDDLADVFAALPEGVNLTCFIDCCHSGTVTRVMVGPAGDGDGHDRRARFLPATPEMEAAHHRFRERIGGTRTAPLRSAAAMRQVVFSACRDYEVAFETSGHGDFTVRATRVLDGGIAGLTHEAFQERVSAAFGEGARQHPELDCAPGAGVHPLLAPLAARAVPPPAGTDGRGGPVAAGTGAGGPSAASLAQALRTLANALAPAP